MRSSGTHHLSAWRSSGLSISAYCRKSGVSRQAFYYWRRQEKEKRSVISSVSGNQPVPFTEIRFPATRPYLIRFPNASELEIPRGFDQGEVGHLVEALWSIAREHH